MPPRGVRVRTAPLFASRGRKLSQRDHHERQHYAGGQQGSNHNGGDGSGPQRACRGRDPSAQASPTPGTPLPNPLHTSALVQLLLRCAVLRARR